MLSKPYEPVDLYWVCITLPNVYFVAILGVKEDTILYRAVHHQLNPTITFRQPADHAITLINAKLRAFSGELFLFGQEWISDAPSY